eukprot:SAG22_NODE_23_length_31399_cov_35.631313_24_plen_118_part_00
MLLQSWEGFLRFFPVYPPGEPAAFTNLRAVGAFVVSASRSVDGSMAGITIVSEAGQNCTLLPPVIRDGATGNRAATIKVVTRAGAAVPTMTVAVGRTAGLLRFETAAGESYKVVVVA